MSQEIWNVMLVEDSEEDRAQIRRALLKDSARPIHFIEAFSGDEASAYIRERRDPFPDVMLLDLNLPGSDGFETLERLNDGKGYLPLPTLVLTGLAQEDEAARALELGAQDFIEKSAFTTKGLTRAILNACERYRLSHQVRQSENQFRAIFNQTFQHVFLLGVEGTVLDINDTLSDYLGSPLKRLKETPLWKWPCWNKRDSKQVEKFYTKALSDGVTARFEARLQGTIELRTFDFSMKAIHDETGISMLILEGRDITDRKRADQLRHRMATIIEATSDFVGTATTDGQFLSLNPAFREVLGVRKEEVTQLQLADIYPDWALQRILQDAIPQAIEVDEWRGEAAIFDRDGNEIPVSQVIIAHRSESKEIRYLSTIMREISEIKQVEEALREADRRKNDFLAILAHELRNPLAAISGGIQLLSEPNDSLPMESLTGILKRQTLQLTRIIDDLLDVSRITRGKIDLRKEKIALAPVVSQAIDVTRELMRERQHSVHVELPHAPLWLDADPTRIEQILVNLLTNAAKYTNPGGEIWVRASQVNDQLALCVKDNGLGLSKEAQRRIFEMFVQIEGALTHSEGGLGLGLTLVRTLTELHGGYVDVESEGEGKGCSFWIYLPAAEAPDDYSILPDRHIPYLDSHGRKGKILVVDDNEDLTISLCIRLRQVGHQVVSFHSPLKALEEIDRIQPEVVLLDIGMPEMNGYQLARRIQEKSLNPVLIAISGFGQNRDLEVSKKIGIKHHLIKPVDFEQLLEIVDEELETLPEPETPSQSIFSQSELSKDFSERKSVESNGDSNLFMEPKTTDSAHFDQEDSSTNTLGTPLKILVVDDIRSIREIVSAILKRQGHEVQTASDGQEGLNLLQEFHPEVILCDLEMPGDISGIEVAKAVRNQARLANTIMIAVTGHSLEDYSERAEAAGFDSCLTKPLDYDELDTWLRQAQRQATQS
ncbi:Hypothetical protein PBC10988_6110 [Planctomycetales bacterium 10988]|nr:Hypothetical protein PBC10988_6110 [Planctomycetales bacterium 10988]